MRNGKEMPVTDKLAPTTYNQLRAQITEIVTTARERAWQAVEQEKVRTCWEGAGRRLWWSRCGTGCGADRLLRIGTCKTR